LGRFLEPADVFKTIFSRVLVPNQKTTTLGVEKWLNLRIEKKEQE